MGSCGKKNGYLALCYKARNSFKDIKNVMELISKFFKNIVAKFKFTPNFFRPADFSVQINSEYLVNVQKENIK